MRTLSGAALMCAALVSPAVQAALCASGARQHAFAPSSFRIIRPALCGRHGETQLSPTLRLRGAGDAGGVCACPLVPAAMPAACVCLARPRRFFWRYVVTGIGRSRCGQGKGARQRSVHKEGFRDRAHALPDCVGSGAHKHGLPQQHGRRLLRPEEIQRVRRHLQEGLGSRQREPAHIMKSHRCSDLL